MRTMDNSEIQLVKLAQQGDTRAFDKLVQLHDRRIYQYAFSVVGNVQDAQDVYQETFMRAFAKLKSFAFEGPFSAWLNRIVLNLAINRKKQKQRRRWFTPLSHDNDQPSWEEWLKPDPNPDPERITLSKEIRSEVIKALDDLPAQQRAVFVLRHFHQQKICEIAESLDCAEGTIKNQLFRATQKLKKQLVTLYEETV